MGVREKCHPMRRRRDFFFMKPIYHSCCFHSGSLALTRISIKTYRRLESGMRKLGRSGTNGQDFERRSGWRKKSVDWSLGLRASKLKWEKILKNIHDSLLRLSDGVKKDKRNGYQMRERESPRCRTLQVLSARVFFWEGQILIFEFFSSSVSARAEIDSKMLLT